MSRNVVITGCSSGIGRATALRLAGNGYRVFAGVRSPHDAEELSARAGEGELVPLALDVTDSGQIAGAAERVSDTCAGEGLLGLVNNAGIRVPGPLEALPIDDFREQLEVNLVGQLAVTQAFLPQLRAERGRIIFLSSIGGRAAAFPFAGAYHASRFGLEAMGKVLRQELREAGVGVVMIELEEQKDSMDPEKVAAAIERALTSRLPGSRDPVGAGATILARARPLIPDAVFDRLASLPFGRA